MPFIGGGAGSESMWIHRAVHIHLGKNLRIELDRGFDPFTLRTVIEAVGGTRPCCP